MKILITNDDGIDAEGIRVLHSAALELTDAKNIFVIAPAEEQSGVSHAITYTKPLRYDTRSANQTAVFGTPADCVLVGIFDVMKQKPDLVLSGINRGNNAAQNTLYSGTMGAAIEAAMHGVHSIALSQFFGPRLEKENTFDAAQQFSAETIQRILDANVWSGSDGIVTYNVNFPPCPANEVKGFEFTSQGTRAGSPFHSERIDDELWLRSKVQHTNTEAGTDVNANLRDLVSITPCTINLTDQSALDQLRSQEK